MELRVFNWLKLESPFICLSCRKRARKLCAHQNAALVRKRPISHASLRKTEQASLAWEGQAKEILAGRQDSMLSILEKRGYVNQIIGERKDLDRLLTEKRVGVYLGIDPTAPSMHVGHLVPLMALYWMYCHGFYACSLLGGATAKVGDPSGRNTARKEQSSSERKLHVSQIHYQLKAMWSNVETRVRHHGYQYEWPRRREITNNAAWLEKLPVIELLKVMAPGVRLGAMLGRDHVKQRLKNGDGMSVAEFLYPMLQAWDWWYMFETKDIQLQIGGSDQFGNILAGVNAINYIRKTHYDPDIRQDEQEMEKPDWFRKMPMGFTVPLLKTASGEKFGKSAGNAIWLDREMTSPFDLYQFFLRTADADVHRYLKLLTFESIASLKEVMQEHERDPSKRVAQHKLAQAVLHTVHGEVLARQAAKEHSLLFQPRPRPKPPLQEYQQDTATKDDSTAEVKAPNLSLKVNARVPQTGPSNMPNPSAVLPMSLVYDKPISKVLYHAGFVASKSEGHRLCANGGAYIGSRPGGTGTMYDQIDFLPCINLQSEETAKYIIDGNLMLFRMGKWKIRVVRIIPDEEFEKQGLDVPGWKEWKEELAWGTAKREMTEEGISQDLLNKHPVNEKKHLEQSSLSTEKEGRTVSKVSSLPEQTTGGSTNG